MESPGFDRLSARVFPWTQERQDTYRQGKAFWGIYRWQDDLDYHLWAWFSGGPGNHGQHQQISAAGRSGHPGREGDLHRLKLLYLPRGISW